MMLDIFFSTLRQLLGVSESYFEGSGYFLKIKKSTYKLSLDLLLYLDLDTFARQQNFIKKTTIY